VASLSPADRRARLLCTHDIDLVVDVGANAGQYASSLRAVGYERRIASFEPLSEPYRGLAAASAEDAAWDSWQLALGARTGIAAINIAEDTRNSSVLAVGEHHLRAVPTRERSA